MKGTTPAETLLRGQKATPEIKIAVKHSRLLAPPHQPQVHWLSSETPGIMHSRDFETSDMWGPDTPGFVLYI